MKQRAFFVFVGIALCVMLAGCSRAGAEKGTVRGTVTLDGQPIKVGNIRFEPADGQTATADATIVDGQFTATVPPGKKRVAISATKVTGKRRMYETPDSPVVDIVAEALPARYNMKTELSMTVTLDDQTQDFPLQSK